MKRPGKTTIQISDEQWIRLNNYKVHKGDSMEKVLEQFIPKVNIKTFWKKKGEGSK